MGHGVCSACLLEEIDALFHDSELFLRIVICEAIANGAQDFDVRVQLDVVPFGQDVPNGGCGLALKTFGSKRVYEKCAFESESVQSFNYQRQSVVFALPPPFYIRTPRPAHIRGNRQVRCAAWPSHTQSAQDDTERQAWDPPPQAGWGDEPKHALHGTSSFLDGARRFPES